MPRIAIIGAGLAGLTLAHGLRTDGHDVEVFERSASAAEQPASYGIHLNADGLTALHRCLPRKNWDLLDAAGAPAPDRVNFRDSMLHPLAILESEKTSAAIDPIIRRRAVARGALHEALLTDLGDDVVRWGREFVDYRAAGRGVEAEFGDGSRAQCDVLVGADGCNSRVRAAAVAALRDQAFLDESYRVNRAGYRQLTAAFDAAGIRYIPSSGNFVLFEAGTADDAGARVNLALLKQGVIVRPVANYGLPRWLRVSIGTEAENAAFLTALPSALRAAA